MGELRLFAVGIDEARDVFGAPPALAELLRASTAHLYPPPPRKRRLRDKLGPLTRAPLLPDPSIPMPGDADELLAGRFVRPDRVPAAWVLIEHWLTKLSWGVYAESLQAPALDEWDFALAKVGVSSAYGIGHLFNEELGFPVRPMTQQRTGYARHAHVAAAATALTAGVDQLEGDPAAWTRTLVGWLDRYPTWTAAADSAGRPRPDLLAVFTA